MKCCGPRNGNAVHPIGENDDGEGPPPGSCAWYCGHLVRDCCDPMECSEPHSYLSGLAWGLPYGLTAAELGAGGWSGCIWFVACVGNAALSSWNLDQRDAEWNLDENRKPKVIKTNPWVLTYCSEPCAVNICIKKNCCKPPDYDEIGGRATEMSG